MRNEHAVSPNDLPDFNLEQTMSRPLRVLFVLVTATGCGGPAPEIKPVQVDQETVSQAQPIEFADTDWPLWRGVNQSGVTTDNTEIPTSWSATENVLWKSPVSGTGHSSPIIVGQHVFLTTADESSQTQSLLCFDRETGKLNWEKAINQGELPRKHHKNSFASATPASDGHKVFVSFVNHNRLQVVAVDFDGNILWDTEAGGFQSEHGYGASPTLYENYVIVSGDGRGAGFLAAIDRASGKIAWRTPRSPNGGHGSYSTPVVVAIAGRPQLIHSGYNTTVSYDPETGTEIWRVNGPSTVTANTVVTADPFVIVSGGYSEKQILCIKADGEGDVSDSHIVWTSKRNIAYVPSPIIDGESVIILTDDGIATSYEIKSGKRLWQKRIGGNYTASPVKIGNSILLTNEQGEIGVYEASKDFKLLHTNRLDTSGGMATLAVSGNRLFIRTASHLYSIGNPTNPEQQVTQTSSGNFGRSNTIVSSPAP